MRDEGREHTVVPHPSPLIRHCTSIRGFSLFELLVAIICLSILFSMTATIFRAGIVTYANHDRGLSPYTEARTIFTMIERDISLIVPSVPGGTIRFNGTQDRMNFVATDEDDALRGVSYRYNAGAYTLERYDQTVQTAEIPAFNQTADALSSNVTAFSIGYYSGVFSNLRLTTSYNTWPSGSVVPTDTPSVMPKALLVSITIRDQKDTTIHETFSRLYAIRARIGQ